MPKVQISPEDKEKVKTAAFYLKKQKDTSLPVATKLAVQFELKAFEPRILQMAEAILNQVPAAPPVPASGTSIPVAPPSPPESGKSAPVAPTPPPAPPLDQATIDEFTKVGKAKKVGDSITNAAKYAMGDDDRLLPSKIRESMKKPRQMVEDAGSWKQVKKLYVSDEPTMRLILQFRIDEVGRIYKQVIKQMWDDNAGIRKEYEKTPTPEKANEVFELNDLQFAMMGSTDLTSDYDVSFDHNANKPWVGTAAVKIFNEKFRAEWGKEAGTVFDTNVYTQGFMPSDMSNIPAGLEKSVKGRIENVDKLMAAETSPEAKRELAELKTKLEKQAKTAARVREHMAQEAIDTRSEKRVVEGDSKKAVFQIEDMMSMVKIRKFMDTDKWGSYTKLLLEGLPEGEARETAISVLAQANDTYVALNRKLKEKMEELKAGRTDVDEDDLELEASNRLYEEYLQEAGSIVAANKGILSGPAISDWTSKQSTALYFANEAYHTSGPVESTVIGQQMGIGMKQVAEQHLQAINEQTGFVIEQHEHAYDDKGLFKQGRFLWKSAKYVDRICSIVDQIKKDIGPDAVVDPKHLDVLKPLSAELLKIKKTTDPDETKDRKSVSALPSGALNIRKMVEELNADVNQQLRIKAQAPAK